MAKEPFGVGTRTAFAVSLSFRLGMALLTAVPAPVLQSLADAGPALTRALSLYTTFPWPKDTLDNWMRGDYGNLSLVLDMTLSRIDSGMFTGTRWEGDLTELELQWGRTIGQLPSPYTAVNPLIVPYHWDQGR